MSGDDPSKFKSLKLLEIIVCLLNKATIGMPKKIRGGDGGGQKHMVGKGMGSLIIK